MGILQERNKDCEVITCYIQLINVNGSYTKDI